MRSILYVQPAQPTQRGVRSGQTANTDLLRRASQHALHQHIRHAAAAPLLLKLKGHTVVWGECAKRQGGSRTDEVSHPWSQLHAIQKDMGGGEQAVCRGQRGAEHPAAAPQLQPSVQLCDVAAAQLQVCRWAGANYERWLGAVAVVEVEWCMERQAQAGGGRGGGRLPQEAPYLRHGQAGAIMSPNENSRRQICNYDCPPQPFSLPRMPHVVWHEGAPPHNHWRCEGLHREVEIGENTYHRGTSLHSRCCGDRPEAGGRE